MTVQKVIVLLHQSYNRGKAEITISITTRCNDDKITVIDMITIQDQYDPALHQLIQTISNQKKPVALVIPSNILTSNSCFITWAIIKALSSAKLLEEVQIYRKNHHSHVSSYFIEKKLIDFFSISLEHFQRAVRRIYVQLGSVMNKIKSLLVSK